MNLEKQPLKNERKKHSSKSARRWRWVQIISKWKWLKKLFEFTIPAWRVIAKVWDFINFLWDLIWDFVKFISEIKIKVKFVVLFTVGVFTVEHTIFFLYPGSTNTTSSGSTTKTSSVVNITNNSLPAPNTPDNPSESNNHTITVIKEVGNAIEKSIKASRENVVVLGEPKKERYYIPDECKVLTEVSNNKRLTYIGC